MYPPPPSWFSLNKSETAKAVTRACCSIQKRFIRNIRAKFGIPNSDQSLKLDKRNKIMSKKIDDYVNNCHFSSL